MDLSLFAVDQDRVDKGVWHKFSDGRIRIARANNSAYIKCLEKKMKAHPELDPDTEAGAELQNIITTEAMAETILTDWENVTDDGKVMPYSVKIATEQMLKYTDFREYVSGMSLNNNYYRTNKIALLEGKSQPPLGGTKSTQAGTKRIKEQKKEV